MKIFDCFMYFDEDLVLDLRLNLLDKFVDHFVIVESKFTHKGEIRSLKFDINKFKKFKNKIIYKIFEEEPKNIEIINEKDDHSLTSKKNIFNAGKRENGQRNYLMSGLNNADDNDIILMIF